MTDGIRFRQLRGIAEGFHHRIAQVVRRYEFGARALRDFDCITDMIGMSVRDQDQFNPLERCDFLLASLVNGIREPGIDKKNITARRNDLKSRLSIPGQLTFHTGDETEKISRSKSNDRNNDGQIQMTKPEPETRRRHSLLCYTDLASTLQRFNALSWRSYSSLGFGTFRRFLGDRV